MGQNRVKRLTPIINPKYIHEALFQPTATILLSQLLQLYIEMHERVPKTLFQLI